jgi:hypothetical protein
MATRSTIALEFADGTVQQVYCHWDGYLDNNGKILQEHYTDPFKLQKLIDLGAMSSLGPEIGDQHSFDIPHKYGTPEYQAEVERRAGITTFYHRDRGEELVVSKFKDFQEYTREAQREEYDYILRNVNGVATWFVSFYGTDGEYLTMADAFEFQKAREGEEA